jgi:hypothetical protein
MISFILMLNPKMSENIKKNLTFGDIMSKLNNTWGREIIERKEKDMRVLWTIILVVAMSLTCLQNQSEALDWTIGDHNIPGIDGTSFGVLNTYNDVTTTMFNGGYVEQFNTYGDSALTMYDGHIVYLNLYQNSIAELRGGNIFEIYVDSTSTSFVKFYAEANYGPNGGRYNNGAITGWWLSDGREFYIDFRGADTYTHIQVIPEPATLVLLGLGALVIFRRHR